jgi:ankyrin repeat protein
MCGVVRFLAGNGATPLHWAAGVGNAAAVAALLAHGADPTVTTYTWRYVCL